MARGLSRGRIVEEALALVDEQGLDRLSMRALASRLGVDPMAAYRHVPGKAALLDGVIEAVMAQVDLDLGGGGWDERVGLLCERLYAGLLRHPNVLPLLTSRVWGTGASLTLVEAGLELGAEAGLDPHESALALNCTALFLVSLAQATAGTTRLAEPDPVRQPHLAALMASGRGPQYHEMFQWWVECLIQRLRSGRG